LRSSLESGWAAGAPGLPPRRQARAGPGQAAGPAARRLEAVCSSRLTEDGRCIVTSPGVDCPVGRVFYIVSSYAAMTAAALSYADYQARLVLSQSYGRPWGEGVTVLPPDGELLELVANGYVAESLAEEPRAA
jgi:hypothetical protein